MTHLLGIETLTPADLATQGNLIPRAGWFSTHEVVALDVLSSARHVAE